MSKQFANYRRDTEQYRREQAEAERLAAEAVIWCECVEPLRSRMYAGLWICRLCNKSVKPVKVKGRRKGVK